MNDPGQAAQSAGAEHGSGVVAPLPRPVKILGWASLLNDVASEMVFPLIPTFLVDVLGGSRVYLGLIEGCADAVASVLKLLSGYWSDRSRHPARFVIVGYALSTLCRTATALVTTPWQLLLTRSGDRVGKGLRTSPRDALLAETTPAWQRGRAFGFHRAMDHLGAAIGPLLASLFLWFYPGEIRWLFLASLVPGAIILALLLLGLRHLVRPVDDAPVTPLATTAVGSSFWWYFAAVLVATLGTASDAFLLLRAGELGVGLAWLPLLWMLVSVVRSAGNWAAGKLVDRVGPRWPLITGWALGGVTYFALGWATTAWHGVALLLIYGVHTALREPAERTCVANIVGRRRQGMAFGWFNFAEGIAVLPASLLFGVLYDWGGAAWAFSWGAGLTLVAIGLLTPVRMQPRR